MSWISVAKTSAKTRPLKPSQSLQQIRHLCASSKSCSWFILRREETPEREGPSPELSLACVGRVLPVCSNHWIICLFPVPVTPPWFQGRFQVARVLLGWPKGLGPAESGSDNRGFPPPCSQVASQLWDAGAGETARGLLECPPSLAQHLGLHFFLCSLTRLLAGSFWSTPLRFAARAMFTGTQTQL